MSPSNHLWTLCDHTGAKKFIGQIITYISVGHVGLQQCLTAVKADSPEVCSKAANGLADAYEEAPNSSSPSSTLEVILPGPCKLA